MEKLVRRGRLVSMGGMGEALRGKLEDQSYEGLPPEVGAFNSQKRVHAPWPVHNFTYFCQF